MRVLFLGTPEFAVPSLRALVESSEFEVRGVITQPDRPAGRGQRLTAPPVKTYAESRDIPVLQTERLRRDARCYALLESVRPELIVVVAFGQILPRDFFGHPKWGTVNVHASLLPRYRGAAPIAHAILNGEKETGTTIMLIDEGMDTGDMLSSRSITIAEEVTAGELESILAQDGARLLIETLPRYRAGEIQTKPQDHSKATYAPRLEKSAGRLDWTRPSRCLHDQIRGLNPWPVAFSSFRGETVRIWRSSRPEDVTSLPAGSQEPGTVIEVAPEGIWILCGNSTRLLLAELQSPGRNRLRGREFANGLKIKPAEQFR